MLSIGPLSVQKIEYPHRKFIPLVEKGWTNEIEEPYRLGTCLVLRIPFTKPGFVLGVWERSKGFVYDEDADDMLAKALRVRDMDLNTEEIGEWNV